MKALVLPLILTLSFIATAQEPAAIERQLLGYLDAVSKSGSYSGEYDEDKNSKANDAIRQTLEREGKRLDVLQYAFPKLKDQMYVATSPDGWLRIYSWDLQTGGTMHDYDCVIQYQGHLTNEVFAKHCSSGGREDAGGFYSRVSQVDIPLGRIYLANSTFIADGMTHGQSIELFGISGNALGNPKFIQTAKGLTNTISFAYSPFTIRDGIDEDGLVTFDREGRSFRFPVVIEEKDSGAGRITSRFITYRFNGRYFVKVS